MLKKKDNILIIDDLFTHRSIFRHSSLSQIRIWRSWELQLSVPGGKCCLQSQVNRNVLVHILKSEEPLSLVSSQWGWFCPSTPCLLPGSFGVVVSECFPLTVWQEHAHCFVKALPENLLWQRLSLKQISLERSNQNCPLQNVGMREQFNSPLCGCIKQWSLRSWIIILDWLSRFKCMCSCIAAEIIAPEKKRIGISCLNAF